jgi:hypothetical protein
MLIEYKMSLSNLSNSFNLSLDGLSTIIADSIILNGVDLNNKITGDYVPYVGATKDVNLNGKNLSNINVLDVSGSCNIAGATTVGGVLSAGANKITSSAVPTANSDVINVLYANTNHYNKTYIDTLIALYYTKTQIDTIFTSYYTKSYIDSLIALYYTKSQIDTTLTNYYTKSYIDSLIALYYTKSQIDTTFANYYTKSYIDSLIALYYTKSQVDTTFTNYYTKSQVDTTFTSYYNKSYIDSLIALYYTKTQIDASLALYYTKTQIDATFTSYYTKSYIDSLIALYYTKTQIDASLGLYYTKAQIDTNNYTKTATDTLLALKATISYVDTQDALKLNLSGGTLTGSLSSNSDITTSGRFVGKINSGDIRILKPNDLSYSSVSFHFGSFNNNNTNNWSDCLHFNSYGDASGGSQNVLMLNKSSINMRIFQNSFLATTAYSLYKDVILIDSANIINFNTLLTSSTLNINTTNTQATNIGNSTGILTLNGSNVNVNGTLNMQTNKITSTYVAINNADLINLLYLMTNYYNKSYIDSLIALYYTKTQIDASLALYYTKAQIDTNNYTKTATDTLLALKSTISYVDTQNALKLNLTGTTTDLNMNAKNISNVNTISGNLLNIKNGNTAYSTVNNAITLEYFGGGYKHAIKSRHNAGADDYGNAIDFYIWKMADTSSVIGTKQLMSITSVGVGIFKNNPAYALDVVGTCFISGNTTIGGILNAGVNKITSSYIPVNNEDLINKLYLTTNNYTKTQTDSNTTTALSTFLGTVNTFTVGQIFNAGIISNGNIDAGNNRVIANLAPVYNNDCANKLYVDNQIATIPTYYYNKTQIDTNLYTQAQTNTLLNAKANLSGAAFYGDVSSTGTFYGNLNGTIRALDNRALKPSDLGAGHVNFSFGSFQNNGGSGLGWSDCIHFNSYWDGSGGSQNLLMLSKGSLKLRVYQGGYGSTTAYSTYADALMIDSSNKLLNSVTASTTNNKLLTLSSTNILETRVIGAGVVPIFQAALGAYFTNWAAGVLQNSAFTTVKAYQTVLFTGHVSCFSPTANVITQANLKFTEAGTTTTITVPLTYYTNVSGNHFIIPINITYQFVTATSYNVYLYGVSNITTDGNDQVYLNAIVLF